MHPGTNSPAPISFVGQLSVFVSPHSTRVLLVDRAELDRYNRLVWVALLPDDPAALDAIAAYKSARR